MKPLTLQLMKQWFDMIKSGVKKEEYREINAYYIARLCRMYYNPHAVRFYDFDRLVLRNGRRADSPTIVLKNPKIRIGTGRPEWGAEPGKNYFVITWEA